MKEQIKVIFVIYLIGITLLVIDSFSFNNVFAFFCTRGFIALTAICLFLCIYSVIKYYVFERKFGFKNRSLCSKVCLSQNLLKISEKEKEVFDNFKISIGSGKVHPDIKNMEGKLPFNILPSFFGKHRLKIDTETIFNVVENCNNILRLIAVGQFVLYEEDGVKFSSQNIVNFQLKEESKYLKEIKEGDYVRFNLNRNCLITLVKTSRS